MNMLKIIKKIIATLLIFNLTLVPVSADIFDYSKYDFSDEAQMKFDSMQNSGTYYPVEDDLSINKEKNKEKQKSGSKVNTDSTFPDNNDYYPEYRRNVDIPQNISNPYLEDITNITRDANKSQPLRGSVVYVPAGTAFTIMFESGISSGSLDRDDRLTAILSEDFVYNGSVIAPAGSYVSGTVTDAQAAGYAYGTGSMALNFDEIMPLEGSPFKISTQTLIVKGQSTRAKSMTRDVLVGTGIGLIGGMLGFLLTGGSGGEQFVRALAIGGGIGAAAGGVRGGMTRGEDVRIPDGTKVKLKLTQPINISPYNI